MNIIHPQPIPDWLYAEVEAYFVPLAFVPASILDIGANVGAFAQRAHQRWPDAHIICCEPMPFNVTQLRHHAPPGTQIISAAIREHSGVDQIYLGDNFASGGFHAFGRQIQQKLMVECLAASRLPSCELVKIDTEGCEVEIVKNLDLSQTQALFLEHHNQVDAMLLKKMLARDFELVGAESGKALGILRFVRRQTP